MQNIIDFSWLSPRKVGFRKALSLAGGDPAPFEVPPRFGIAHVVAKIMGGGHWRVFFCSVGIELISLSAMVTSVKSCRLTDSD